MGASIIWFKDIKENENAFVNGYYEPTAYFSSLKMSFSYTTMSKFCNYCLKNDIAVYELFPYAYSGEFNFLKEDVEKQTNYPPELKEKAKKLENDYYKEILQRIIKKLEDGYYIGFLD